MRTKLLVTAWGIVVFLFAIAWLLPVDALVRQQLRGLEQKTGVTVRFDSAHWSLWRSTLRNVTVRDRNGTTWLSLASLDVRPRFDRIQLTGHAAWGLIRAVVTRSKLELAFDGWPVSTPAGGQIQDGKLRANLTILQANFQVHGTYGLSGQMRLLQFYKGPGSISGQFDLDHDSGTVSVELAGDRLHGEGNLDLNTTGSSLGQARIDGIVRVELDKTLWNLHLSGPVGSPTITTQ